MILDIKSGVRERWHELQTSAYDRSQPNIVSPLVEFYEDGHVYKRAGRFIPSVTTVIKDAGYISDFAMYSEFRRQVGKVVHDACAILPRLDWSSVDPRVGGYVISLVKWLEQSGFVVTDREQLVYNQQWDYAGRLDLRGRFANLGMEGRGALYLDKNGKVAKFHRHTKKQDFQEFLVALKKWRSNHANI